MANPKADMDQRAVQLVQEFGDGILTPAGVADALDVPIGQDRKIGVTWARAYWTGMMWWDPEAGPYYVPDATAAHKFRGTP